MDAVYHLSFQLGFRVDDVSAEEPTSFGWYAGFGTQNQFVDYQLGAGVKFHYNSGYDNNQLKLKVGSGHQNEINTSQLGYEVGRNTPMDWSAKVEIELAQGVATYWIDGVEVGSAPHSDTIGGLWFKGTGTQNIQDDLVTVSDLLLTQSGDSKRVSIPEPGCSALWLSLSAVLLVCMHRR